VRISRTGSYSRPSSKSGRILRRKKRRAVGEWPLIARELNNYVIAELDAISGDRFSGGENRYRVYDHLRISPASSGQAVDGDLRCTYPNRLPLLLARDGYDLTLRTALMIAKRQLEEELSNLDTQAADWKRDRD
jgi:hypothetical protein